MKKKLLLTIVVAGLHLSGTNASAQAKDPQQVWQLWSATTPLPAIIVPDNANSVERDAATQLETYLERISNKQTEVLAESNAKPRHVIFVGNTQHWRQINSLTPVQGEESYQIEIDAGQQTAVIGGQSKQAIQFAVNDFLYRFGGVRWFLPDPLFEVVPQKTQLSLQSARIVEEPDFTPRTFGYLWYGAKLGYTGEQVPELNVDRWAMRNRLSSDGRGRYPYISHNLSTIITPALYGKTNPEYFPLRDGKRHIPDESAIDWQPELTNPEVVQIFIEAGRKFFRQNSESWQWFSLGVNDGNVWSQSEEAKAAIGEPYRFRGRDVHSDMYYAFVAKVASTLEKEFPGRKISLIAYLDVELPPRNIEKLPPNVNVMITQESAQYHDEKYRLEDEALLKRWLEVANGNVYRYDYHAMYSVAPRYYPTIVATDARRMKQTGLKGFYTEDIPVWPWIGPLLYVTSRMWWDVNDDPDKLLHEFHQQLFGPAAEPMQRYFALLEKAWHTPRPGQFFEGLGDPRPQVAIYPQELRVEIDAVLALAGERASTDEEKQRVAFFAKGWKLSRFYLLENELLQQLTKQPEKTVELSQRLLQVLDEHQTYQQEFRQESQTLNGSICWILDDLGRDSGWIPAAQSKVTTALVAYLREAKNANRYDDAVRLLNERFTSPSALAMKNLVVAWAGSAEPVNLALFAGAGDDSWQPGPPPEWGWWSGTTSTALHNRDSARLENATAGASLMKRIPVRPGQVYAVTIEYRTSSGYTGEVGLRCRWQDANGSWYGEKDDVILNGMPSQEWQKMQIISIVPEGVETLVLLAGANKQKAGEWIEYRNPYIGIASGTE